MLFELFAYLNFAVTFGFVLYFGVIATQKVYRKVARIYQRFDRLCDIMDNWEQNFEEEPIDVSVNHDVKEKQPTNWLTWVKWSSLLLMLPQICEPIFKWVSKSLKPKANDQFASFVDCPDHFIAHCEHDPHVDTQPPSYHDMISKPDNGPETKPKPEGDPIRKILIDVFQNIIKTPEFEQFVEILHPIIMSMEQVPTEKSKVLSDLEVMTINKEATKDNKDNTINVQQLDPLIKTFVECLRNMMKTPGLDQLRMVISNMIPGVGLVPVEVKPAVPVEVKPAVSVEEAKPSAIPTEVKPEKPVETTAPPAK